MAEFYANKQIPDFPWGPVIKLHQIDGLDLIVEHHPMIFREHHGTGQYDYDKSHFTLCIKRECGFSWEGYSNLERAILGAISQKFTGSTSAALWMFKLLATKEASHV